MLTKTKKILLLSSGLAGALAASSVAGVALSSCTVETVNGGSNSSNGITLPDTWYNKDINWTDATSLNNLIIDKNGLVYSNKYMTEIIAILPGYGGSTITIPASVKTISGYNKVTTDSTGATTKTTTGAFEGLTSLTKIVFAGKNVTQIGARAFYGCTGLQSITLPSSVTLVDTNAFNGCTSLSSINLDNVQYIGISAFEGAMTDIPAGSISLNLNKTVLIGSNAFSGATGISSVDFSKNTTLTQIADGAFSGCTSLAGDIDLTNATKLITIGNASTPTTGSSFANTAITNVYLPSTAGLRIIAAMTFSGCTNLVTVGPKGTTGFKATESISGIYNQAFAGTKIASADISAVSSTTPLQAGAFSGMTALTSVSLGTTITTIPASCFMNCSALTSLELPTSITSISGGTPSVSTGSGTITFSSSDNNASYPAFYGSGLTSLDLSNITSYQTTSGSTLALPDTIFYNCASLTSITLKAGTTSIGKGSFAGTTKLTSISTGTSTKASDGYTATSDVTTVYEFAFWQSGLSSIDLSNINGGSFTTLQNYTLSACPNLTTIKLPSTITTIATNAVIDTPELTTVNFEDLALAKINNNNFSDCKLTSVDLTKSTIVNITDDNIFKNLTKTTTVKLPSLWWNIGNSNAFTYAETTTNDDGTTTTTSVLLNVTFPDGFAPTNSTATSTLTAAKGNLTAHKMFARISGSLDMSSFEALKSIGIRTFFGGPVESLTFNASSFADGKFGSYYEDTTSGSWSHLGFVGANATTGDTTKPEYAETSLPFGSMTNLNAIKFSNFTSATTNDTTTSTEGAMAKTTTDTWNQVAKIMSSFGKEAVEKTPSTTTNLTEWDDQQNVTAEVTSNDSNVVTSVILKTTDGNSTVTISDDSTTEQTITVSGITWTIKVDKTAGTITITSSADVDTYRAVVASSSSATTTYDKSYKAFFNTKEETYTSTTDSTTSQVVVPNSTITVTLNVVAAATE